jgi:signal transduction histidine kinase
MAFSLLLVLVATIPVIAFTSWTSKHVEERGLVRARDRVDQEATVALAEFTEIERALGASVRALRASLESSFERNRASELGTREALLVERIAQWARRSVFPVHGAYSRDGVWFGGWPELPRIDAHRIRALDGHCVGVAAVGERPLERGYFSCFVALSGGELVLMGVPFERLISSNGTRDRVDVDLVLSGSGEPTDGSYERRVVREIPGYDGEPFVELVAIASHAREDQIAGDLRNWGVRFALGGGICALLLGILVGWRAERTLVELEAAAVRIGRGDLGISLAPARSGASETYSAFNRMARELQQAQSRAKRAERVAAWRDIARRIAHEIKNPLMPIRMSMETLRRTKQRQHPDFDEIFDESTATVLEEVARLERIVTEFSRFARLPRPKPVPLDVREVISQVAALYASKGHAGDGTVEVKVTRSLPEIRADRDQLVQALVNLIQNARDAAESRHGAFGHVEVNAEVSAEGGVRVTICDNGPGISEDERARILEPYYTTKAGGTGLGLAIVDRIVSEHGGVLEIGDSPLGGAAISISLTREGPSEEPDASYTN